MMSLKQKLYLCDLECRVRRAQNEMWEAQVACDKGEVSIEYYIEKRNVYKRANKEYVETAKLFLGK